MDIRLKLVLTYILTGIKSQPRCCNIDSFSISAFKPRSSGKVLIDGDDQKNSFERLADFIGCFKNLSGETPFIMKKCIVLHRVLRVLYVRRLISFMKET